MLPPVKRLRFRLLLLSLLVACGSRTGLLFEDDPSPVPFDAGPDVGRPDASLDALPSLDVTPKPDVALLDCPDASDTRIYVVTSQNELFSFYPPTLAFKFVGKLVCAGSGAATPFSMAVDRKGIAHVVYTDGRLYRVSTATAACAVTPYTSGGRPGFLTFGMGFSAETDGTDRLYVASNPQAGNSNGLGSIDLAAYALRFVAPFTPPIPRAELTGTGDGRLFAYWPISGGSFIAEVNKVNGRVVAADRLPTGDSNDAFAFAFWGGSFWVFHSGGGPTDVTRFDPGPKTATTVTTMTSTIVGAGVSTCAPQ